ncbi:reverse transcriptase domain-containing protein [Tanacetum coccineum]
MKQLIAELPTLTAPKEKEELIVYLAAAKKAISTFLMTEREVKQMPICFISRALRDPKVYYTSMEKLVLALVNANKCLKRYFQAYPIIVVMDQPIKQVLSRPEVGQILTDFIVEHPEHDDLDTAMDVEEELPESWTLFMDRSSCANGFGEGLILTNPEGAEFTYALRFSKGSRYDPIFGKNKDTHQRLQDVLIKQVPRSENKKTDALSKITSTNFTHLSKQVLVEELKEKSINELEVLAVVEEEGNTWMTPIYAYLTEETLPAEGIDIARPFLEGPGKVKFLIVAIDYFTKWIEAKPVTTITDSQVKKFVWDNIVCRFGLPGEIIYDNGKQFRDNPFKDWSEKLSIRQHFAPVKHLQANGLVERENRSLGEGIKARLEERNKN